MFYLHYLNIDVVQAADKMDAFMAVNDQNNLLSVFFLLSLLMQKREFKRSWAI